MSDLKMELLRRVKPFRDTLSLRAWAVVQSFWHALAFREMDELLFARSVLRDAIQGHVPEEMMLGAYMAAEDSMSDWFETADESSDGAVEEAFILSVKLSLIPEGRRHSRFLKPFMEASVQHFRGCTDCRSKAVLVFRGVWEASALGHMAGSILPDADET